MKAATVMDNDFVTLNSPRKAQQRIATWRAGFL
jgi:hypothetical protein